MTRRASPSRAAPPDANPQPGRPHYERPQPQKVTLGSPRSGSPATTRILERVAERMARKMRGIFEPLVRSNVRIEAVPVVSEIYGDWLARQPLFLGFAQFGIEPIGLSVMAVISPAAVRDMLDRYFGGDGAAARSDLAEFTLAEERMVVRIASAAMALLAGELPAAEAAEAVLKSHETNPQFAMFVPNDEAVSIIGFAIVIPGGAQHRIDLIVSQALVRMLESGRKSDKDGATTGTDDWSAQLSRATETMRFDARVVVARPDITLRQLMQLQPGDVLPTIVPSVVPLIVAGRTIAHGTIGESDGRAALRIERLEHRTTTQ